MSATRDTNVYQHLLRELRQVAAESFGVNEPNPSELTILRAAVEQATFELEAAADRELVADLIPPIVKRLSFALQLSEGLFDPDHPYRTASAAEYHPDGVQAGFAAGRGAP